VIEAVDDGQVYTSRGTCALGRARHWGLVSVAHKNADHFVALLFEQVGRDARIDSPGHG
jgi:hypothetical protein